MTSQPDGADLEEEFGGTAVNIQVPTGFDAQAVATGLTAPTAASSPATARCSSPSAAVP